MKTTQAWGWLATGVLALGLNGFYQDGGAAWAHRALDGVVERIAGRSGALMTLASEQVDAILAKANPVAAGDETASCRLTAAVARAQSKVARRQSGMAQFEAMSARQEAALARLEANRARIEAQVARVRLAPVAFNTIEIPVVACPRVRVNVPRVNVPRVPRVNVAAPMVRVELGGGPI